MACSKPTMRPLACWKSFLRQSRQQPVPLRCLSTAPIGKPTPRIPPPRLPADTPMKPYIPPMRIKTYPPPPSTQNKHPFAIASFTASHLSLLDPTGSRQRLFSRSNPDVPNPGDILLATFRTGDPFAGVCLSIRRRGVDTAVLLRNRLLTTGVEMWVKVFSPNVKGIEVVKRAEKRARRARLFYMRKPEHDRGSVERVVEQYLLQRRLVRSGAVGMRDPNKGGKNTAGGKVGAGAR